MGAKPKTRKAPTKKSDAEKQKEQSARFIKAAREAGFDESGKEFERVVRKLLPRKG